ncbi:MAG: protein phosphatase 2C domain-containing protein, partial [Alphaproteobacteria bacterium]|nr:protein phosphatase 2C domain-containing protein [Alphaproteobacteria bacterium]
MDMASWGSGEPNEDCAGHAAALAWVIDGATDLVDTPLVGEVSDAAWLAVTAHDKLMRFAAHAPSRLIDLPEILNRELAGDFHAQARLKPQHPWACPSAAALIVRATGYVLEWVALGDCALIIDTGASLATVGIGGAEAGDRSTAAEVSRLHKLHGFATDAERKARIWPRLREQRGARLNQPEGYPVLSITPPPVHLIAQGRLYVEPGTHALLATDGLIRLIDIYARHDARSLFEAAKSRGLES